MLQIFYAPQEYEHETQTDHNNSYTHLYIVHTLASLL